MYEAIKETFFLNNYCRIFLCYLNFGYVLLIFSKLKIYLIIIVQHIMTKICLNNCVNSEMSQHFHFFFVEQRCSYFVETIWKLLSFSYSCNWIFWNCSIFNFYEIWPIETFNIYELFHSMLNLRNPWEVSSQDYHVKSCKTS